MSTRRQVEGTVAIQALIAARRVADLANAKGASSAVAHRRPVTTHMGAIIADAVLQAGVNYTAVVLPRISAILKKFPEAHSVGALVMLVAQRRTGEFLTWSHSEKIVRFNSLVEFLQLRCVETAEDLREYLLCDEIGEELQAIRGVGPKTVDYLACLVGIDSVAVDRHVRTFARMAGVETADYKFLRTVFCYAADLLSLSRRDFDAWIWEKQSSPKMTQLHLSL